MLMHWTPYHQAVDWTGKNQSFENAGVIFVQRADERNKFFELKNNQ